MRPTDSVLVRNTSLEDQLLTFVKGQLHSQVVLSVHPALADEAVAIARSGRPGSVPADRFPGLKQLSEIFIRASPSAIFPIDFEPCLASDPRNHAALQSGINSIGVAALRDSTGAQTVVILVAFVPPSIPFTLSGESVTTFETLIGSLNSFRARLGYPTEIHILNEDKTGCLLSRRRQDITAPSLAAAFLQNQIDPGFASLLSDVWTMIVVTPIGNVFTFLFWRNRSYVEYQIVIAPPPEPVLVTAPAPIPIAIPTPAPAPAPLPVSVPIPVPVQVQVQAPAPVPREKVVKPAPPPPPAVEPPRVWTPPVDPPEPSPVPVSIPIPVPVPVSPEPAKPAEAAPPAAGRPASPWASLDTNQGYNGDNVKKLVPRKPDPKPEPKPEPPKKKERPPKPARKPDRPPKKEASPAESPGEATESSTASPSPRPPSPKPAEPPAAETPKGPWARVQQWDDQGQVAKVPPQFRSSHRAPPAAAEAEPKKEEKKEEKNPRPEKKPRGEKKKPVEKPPTPEAKEQPAKPPAKPSAWDALKSE
jgi:hypothetical protein